MKLSPGLARSVPFGLYAAGLVVEPLLAPHLPADFDLRWLYAIRVGVVLVALLALRGRFSELKEPSEQGWRDVGGAVAIGLVVFALWINLDFEPLAYSVGTGFDPRTGEGMNWGMVAVRMAGAALIVPVMEELFWRSFILRWLENASFLTVPPGTVGVRALAISSVLFATEHSLWLAGFLAGLAYGWIYRKSGSLWSPILAHAATNLALGIYVLSTGAWDFW